MGIVRTEPSTAVGGWECKGVGSQAAVQRKLEGKKMLVLIRDGE